MSGLTSVDMVSASDPKSAMALQRLVQAAVWFLGENTNYAASEYAWESAMLPGTALMMLDADKMVAAASSRNPTLASALTRLQRCTFSGSWGDSHRSCPSPNYHCNKVKDFLAGAGTDAPDVDDEEYMNSRTSVGYGDMWAKTILETYEAEEDDGRYSGGSSPESTGFVETSISSHFGGMNYPSLFSSKPSSHGASQQTIREEPPSYSTSVLQRKESFENPLAGRGGQSFGSHEDEDKSSGNPQSGKALYDFTAGGDDELSLTTGEEVRLNMRSMVGIIFVCSNFQQFSSFIYTPVGKASSCMSNKCHLLKKRRGSISGFLFFIFARDLYLFFRLYETLHY